MCSYYQVTVYVLSYSNIQNNIFELYLNTYNIITVY